MDKYYKENGTVVIGRNLLGEKIERVGDRYGIVKINENIEDTKFKVKESKDKIKEYLAKRKNEKSENEIVEIEPLQLIENTEVAEENTEA